MRTVLIIGIGAGNPEYLTVQAIKALNRVDTFFVVEKGPDKDGLAQLRAEICDRYIERPYRLVAIPDPQRDRAAADYPSAVADWRHKRLEAYESALASHLAPDGVGGFMVWGDPTLYDGTLSIVEAIAARGAIKLEYEVIPGISSVQALAARHRVPLNRVGEAIHITTGRRTPEALESGSENIVVMLDGNESFRKIDAHDLDICWGAYVGTPDEILISGRLDAVADDIHARREDARGRIGWIMDTYLLRKRAP
jgi:precorrin-6A synthase